MKTRINTFFLLLFIFINQTKAQKDMEISADNGMMKTIYRSNIQDIDFYNYKNFKIKSVAVKKIKETRALSNNIKKKFNDTIIVEKNIVDKNDFFFKKTKYFKDKINPYSKEANKLNLFFNKDGTLNSINRINRECLYNYNKSIITELEIFRSKRTDKFGKLYYKFDTVYISYQIDSNLRLNKWVLDEYGDSRTLYISNFKPFLENTTGANNLLEMLIVVDSSQYFVLIDTFFVFSNHRIRKSYENNILHQVCYSNIDSLGRVSVEVTNKFYFRPRDYRNQETNTEYKFYTFDAKGLLKSIVSKDINNYNKLDIGESKYVTVLSDKNESVKYVTKYNRKGLPKTRIKYIKGSINELESNINYLHRLFTSKQKSKTKFKFKYTYYE